MIKVVSKICVLHNSRKQLLCCFIFFSQQQNNQCAQCCTFAGKRHIVERPSQPVFFFITIQYIWSTYKLKIHSRANNHCANVTPLQCIEGILLISPNNTFCQNRRANNPQCPVLHVCRRHASQLFILVFYLYVYMSICIWYLNTPG